MTPTKHKEAGSALLTATVITVMVIGIGGAFLADTYNRGTMQHNSIQADRARIICDAGLERARRALWKNRDDNLNDSTTGWKWNDIFQYCQSVETYMGGAAKGTDLQAIRANYDMLRSSSPDFIQYPYDAAKPGVHTSPTYEAPIPPNRTQAQPCGGSTMGRQNSPDALTYKVFLGWNTPLNEGSFHIFVRDNDDGDGNLLADVDSRCLVTVTASLPDGTQRQIEVLVNDFRVPAPTPPGAVNANADVNTLGNITIDGNDYDDVNYNGAPLGSGVYGIVTKGGATVGGSSSTGGNGLLPPGNGEGANSIYRTYPDTPPPGMSPIPNNPDDVLGLPQGKLKEKAQGKGTYFTDYSAYTSWLSANGGKIPGGSIVYLEVSNAGPPFDVGDSINEKSSILVIHNSTTSAQVKNVHGTFKGLIMADRIDKVNANGVILGAMYTFTASDPDLFGNGTAYIKMSSKALAKLPTAISDSLLVEGYRTLK
jgi:hypothetical protein